MFRIPYFYEMKEMSFDEAWKIMQSRGQGDCLEGMKSMDRLWSEFVNMSHEEQDENNFFDNWMYEVNAYNVVFKNMSKLFH